MNYKKLFPIILIIIVFAIFILSFFIGGKKHNDPDVVLSNDPDVVIENAKKESSNVADVEKKNFVMITVDDYLRLYDSEDPSLVLIARPTCSYSQIAEPIIQNLMYLYDYTIYYLNTDDFHDDDLDRFVHSDERIENGFGTPMLYFIGNHSIIDSVDGLTDRAHYMEFFRLNGYL